MDDIVKRPKRPRIELDSPTAESAAVKRPLSINDNSGNTVQPAPAPAKPLIDLSQAPQKARESLGITQAVKPDPETTVSELPTSQPKQSGLAVIMNRFRSLFRKPRNKKEWAILAAVLVIFLGGSGASAYWFILKPEPEVIPVVVAPVKKMEAPKPTTEASKLSGLQVPFGVNERQVTSIMIENSPDARPQAGLKDASVIFEAIAEGGITRFNALYQDTQPDYIGPVRSIRPYYIDWFMPFDAAVAHAGGSPQALADLKSLGAKDLDQFANSGAYHRITDRYAPHNLYTSIAKLNELENSKGWTTSNYTGFTRKKEAKLTAPTARTIDLAISSFFYNVHYDYDVASNTYLRSQAGEQHRDDRSGTQLAPKVVVAIVMGRGLASNRQHTEYQTVGSGIMYVFQDGGQTEGTWSKESRTAQWKFTDAAGTEIAFNPGQTWISIVDANGDVTFNP